VADAEQILRGARRPLVIGMGGGGDVVGALASAEFCRLYDGSDPIVGGLAWERRPIDPVPGPRREEEITGGEPIAPGVLLAGPQTRVRDRDVHFGESRMSAFLGEPTLLVTIDAGPAAIAAGLAAAVAHLDADLILFVDVGGDVLARGDEAGLRSPLCDAVMLAAAEHLARDGVAVLLGIFGIGCDAELTNEEVLDRVALVAAAGGMAGIRGLTEPIATRLEGAMEHVLTEASAQAVRAFRGASGPVAIRGGEHTLELSPVAALTVYLDVSIAFAAAGDLARAVVSADSLIEANAALTRRGVRTELDLEADAYSGQRER
jgi:hypothetical protein